ncbi:MAG: hypothetical protein E6831_03875 [Veillonella sp.]|nr:hypothetical protein [Veillonella sp.]
MSPGFRNVLRLARIPVDSSEPVRRKFGSRLIGIVTVCLLPLLVFDVPQWVFILSQFKKRTDVVASVLPRFSVVCLQVIHNFKPRICGQVCR